MYHIRPLSVVPDTIDLPKCMYKIQPLTGIQLGSFEGELSVSPKSKRVKMDPELQAIEDRQLEVIARLRKLRDTVDGLISKSGGESKLNQQQGNVPKVKTSQTLLNKESLKTAESNALTDVALPDELVIEADPGRPPLSLLFFANLTPNLKTVTHTHSSCTRQVDQKLISLFSRDPSSPSKSTIRVVWKNVSGLRLTPPTLGSCGVEGESNVARYLSRVLAKPDDGILNYDALPLEDLVLVDGVLESSTVADAAPDQFLNSLQAYVQRRSGSSDASSSRTIADFVGYSTLRYLTKLQPSRSFQKSLIDWMNCLTNEVPSLS